MASPPGSTVSTGNELGQQRHALQLAIPLAPMAELGTFARDRLIGLRGPRFPDAYRVTLHWLLALVVIGVLSRSLVTEPLRVTAAIATVAIAVYVILRVVVLRWLERRQREFEPVWLSARSEELRRQYFEILRFSVQRHRVPRRTTDEHQLYDLVESGSAVDLLRRYSAERQNGSSSWVQIDVAVGPDPDGEYAVQSVRRRLTDVELVAGRTKLESGRARFPSAQYVPRPVFAKRAAKSPSTTTYAMLPDPIRIYVEAAGG
jgi:hypothetical protein